MLFAIVSLYMILERYHEKCLYVSFSFPFSIFSKVTDEMKHWEGIEVEIYRENKRNGFKDA